MAKLALSTIITITYASTYIIIFLITSIYCLFELKEEHKKKQSKQQQDNAVGDTKPGTSDAPQLLGNDGDDGKDEENPQSQESIRRQANDAKSSKDNAGGETKSSMDTDHSETSQLLESGQTESNKPEVVINKEPGDNEASESKSTDPEISDNNSTVSTPEDMHESRTQTLSEPKVYDGNFFIDWCRSIWHKKKIYGALLPHLFDQATDLGTIMVYYDAWIESEEEGNTYTAVDPFWFFVFGLVIIGFQRIVSTVTIYFVTHNMKSAALQFLDLLIVRALWVNYKLGLSEPCNPQRYIELLEAIFESSPQILLSMGWILKSSLDGVSISPIIVISTVFSLWSLTGKVAADDKLILQEGMWDTRGYYKNEHYEDFKSINFKFDKSECPFIYVSYKQYLARVILWRFLEITCRINLLLLIWLNMGGLSLLIILGFELVCCLICCVAEKSPDAMGNIMFMSFSFKNKGWVRWFWVYRFVSSYIFLIIITIFASLEFDPRYVPSPEERSGITLDTKTGFAILVYTWISSFIWPYVLWVLVYGYDMIDGDVFDLSEEMKADHNGGSTRDLFSYIKNGHYPDAAQLLNFGYKVGEDYVDDEGRTLVMVACRKLGIEEKELFEDCCGAGASDSYIDKPDNVGDIPLHYAFKPGKFWMVKILIGKGANIESIDKYYGDTPIMTAVTEGFKYAKEMNPIIKHLLRKGADTNKIDEIDRTFWDICKQLRLHIFVKTSDGSTVEISKENIASYDMTSIPLMLDWYGPGHEDRRSGFGEDEL